MAKAPKTKTAPKTAAKKAAKPAAKKPVLKAKKAAAPKKAAKKPAKKTAAAPKKKVTAKAAPKKTAKRPQPKKILQSKPQGKKYPNQKPSTLTPTGSNVLWKLLAQRKAQHEAHPHDDSFARMVDKSTEKERFANHQARFSRHAGPRRKAS